MELTNEQRRCLGLELVDPAWERVEILNSIKPECESGKMILYFDGDMIRKTISVWGDGSYEENAVHLKTLDNRTMIAPKTKRGKPKKLNAVNVQSFRAEGVYFFYDGHVTLANYTTQQTYFSSSFAGLAPMTEAQLQGFLKQWVLETDEAELERIQTFAMAKRRHCKFRERDFFRYKIDRTHYGYGRILLDVMKLKKSGRMFWDILMGRPLVVSVFHIITENPSVDIQELAKLKCCPSQFIMDNGFYYGEYEIVGNAPLPEDVDYPIMYGRSISAIDRDKIMYQRGRFYNEIPLEGNALIGECDFKNNAIGWGLSLDKNILEECIREDSNMPYWVNDRRGFVNDIRNPRYANELEKVVRQMENKEERVVRYLNLASRPEYLPYSKKHLMEELDLSDDDIFDYQQKMESQLSMRPVKKRDILVKEVIKPLLKKYGFTTSGLDWRRQLEDSYMIIHMVNSQFNGISTGVSFRFHISVTKKDEIRDKVSNQWIYNQTCDLRQFDFLPYCGMLSPYYSGDMYQIDGYKNYLPTDTPVEKICRQIGEDFEKYILPELCKVQSYEDYLELRARIQKRYEEKDIRLLRYYYTAQHNALDRSGNGYGTLVEFGKKMRLTAADVASHLEWLDVCRENSHFTKVDAKEIAVRAARHGGMDADL